MYATALVDGLSSKEKHLALSAFLRRKDIVKMEIGKTYLVKNDIFSLKKGELWTLVDKGYQAYFGEHNFVFVNDEKVKVFAVLQDRSEEDIQIYHHLDDYLEEVTHENFKKM